MESQFPGHVFQFKTQFFFLTGLKRLNAHIHLKHSSIKCSQRFCRVGHLTHLFVAIVCAPFCVEPALTLLTPLLKAAVAGSNHHGKGKSSIWRGEHCSQTKPSHCSKAPNRRNAELIHSFLSVFLPLRFCGIGNDSHLSTTALCRFLQCCLTYPTAPCNITNTPGSTGEIYKIPCQSTGSEDSERQRIQNPTCRRNPNGFHLPILMFARMCSQNQWSVRVEECMCVNSKR